ncbi:MAG: ribonuclease III [Anaerolineales bacterium]|nr:ribonuclease III [Anaerolineales bacterium]
MESPAELAKRLKLPFRQLHLLTRALTHRSFVNENSNVLEDNERLEFLGDAVLDFVVGAWVYNRCPEMHEGDLTRLRSALVRNEQLAVFSRELKLDRALRLGRGELNAGGGRRVGLLGAAFEALIGALFLEAGIEEVKKFVEPLLNNARDKVLNRVEIYDPKSRLQEWAQAQKLGIPDYILVESRGPDHAKTFDVEVKVAGRVYGRGTGSSKHIAELMAAQTALETLKVI